MHRHASHPKCRGQTISSRRLGSRCSTTAVVGCLQHSVSAIVSRETGAASVLARSDSRMSRTAALSWAEFDDEADAPTFDVLGELATAPILRPATAEPRSMAPPIPYAYPSLAPRSAAALKAAPLPAPDHMPHGRFKAGGESLDTEATVAPWSPLVPSASAAACCSSARARQPVLGSAVFKPFKPPRKLAEYPVNFLPAPVGATRLAAPEPSDRCCSSAEPAATVRLQQPGATARAAPLMHALEMASTEAAEPGPLDGSRQAAPARRAPDVPWRHARRRDTSWPDAQRSGAGFVAAQAALPQARRQAPLVETLRRNESAAPTTSAESIPVSADGRRTVLLRRDADREPTPTEGRSRKKAKRLFFANDADAEAAYERQARTL